MSPKLMVPLFSMAIFSASFPALAGNAESDLYVISNQRVLEDTVSRLSVADAVSKELTRGASVAIRNIEAEETTDRKLVALIEDQLISQLVSAGIVVLERDHNAVRRALEERGRGDRFSVIRGKMELLDSQEIKEQQKIESKNSTVVIVDKGTAQQVSKGDQVEDNKKHLLQTHLKGADYLLTYRVQELGINYDESEVENVRRFVIARVHIRLEDAQTGRVLLARNIEAKTDDKVPLHLVGTLANYRYSQFYHSYPGQKPNEDNKINIRPPRIYIQAALLRTFGGDTAGESNSLSLKSPMQIGIARGKERIGFEVFDGSTKNAALQHDGALFIYGRQLGSIKAGGVDFSIVPELGIGNLKISKKEKGGVTQEESVGFKLGVGFETAVFNTLDFRIAVDAYATVDKPAFQGQATAGLRYTFN